MAALQSALWHGCYRHDFHPYGPNTFEYIQTHFGCVTIFSIYFDAFFMTCYVLDIFQYIFDILNYFPENCTMFLIYPKVQIQTISC